MVIVAEHFGGAGILHLVPSSLIGAEIGGFEFQIGDSVDQESTTQLSKRNNPQHIMRPSPKATSII